LSYGTVLVSYHSRIEPPAVASLLLNNFCRAWKVLPLTPGSLQTDSAETNTGAIRQPCGFIAAVADGIALRHCILWVALPLPPAGALRTARQGEAKNRLDLLEG